MSKAEFEFRVEGFRGCRLIRVIIPPRVNVAKLSVAIAQYLALFETTEPIVVINDARGIDILPEDSEQILIAILKRNANERGFYGSAWITGNNEAITKQLREICERAGRDLASIKATETEAFDYLRALIAARERASSDASANDA